jgi:Fe-S-cluster containining protein
MSKMDAVDITKLPIDAKFKFRCHKGIQCFTKCCSNIDILLTPYDVVRLKKRLGMTSDVFLEAYTYMDVDPKTSHPHAMLKMGDDKDRTCPFLSDEGCTVYTDRPANCRYYPVGQGTMNKEVKDGTRTEEFYFFVKEKHCLGYNEKKEWTIKSWREDQGVDEYDKVNSGWKSLQLRKNLPGKELEESKQFQFYMASYDLDRFKRYIFESDFLNIFDIDEETQKKIREDEVELIQFGVRYIKYVMMLEESLKLKPGAEKFRKKK